METKEPSPAAPLRAEEGSVAEMSEQALHRLGLVELTRMLGDRVGQLVHLEIELARAEARGDVKHGMLAGGMLGGAGIAFIAALVCGLDAGLWALGRIFDVVWVSLLGLGTFALLGVGIALMGAAEAKEARPERTLREARQTLALLRHPGAQP